MALTLTPLPWWQPLDNDGNIIPGGKVFTYSAGTSTKKNTYTDVLGQVANSNPIILDAAGRVPSGLFLSPSSYKFVLSPANDTDPPTNPIRSQDNIGSVPVTNVDTDVPGTAGGNISANEAAYLAADGLWYRADADVAASSITPPVGFCVTDVITGGTSTFRIAGRVTGLVGLTIGSDYYLSSTAGAITATAPVLARYVGRADTVSSLIAVPNPPDAGSWTAFTPTWTGSGGNPAIVDGTLTGRYRRTGPTVDFQIFISMGAGTTYGSGTYSFGLPVTALAASRSAFAVSILDSGTARFVGVGVPDTTTTFMVFTDSSVAAVGATVPMTWASGDTMTVGGTYEAA